MRKIILSCALAAGVSAAGALVSGSAGAMTISTPAAVGKAVSSGVTDVAYRCRRVWTRWGWRRACRWAPGPYVRYGYPGYYYGAPYAYYGWRRPYYRRYWW